MYQTLPFPVAYPYQLLEAARSPEDRYDCLIQCYEAVLRYLAAVQLSDYLAAVAATMQAKSPGPNVTSSTLSSGQTSAASWISPG
jgi:hypothetical protein